MPLAPLVPNLLVALAAGLVTGHSTGPSTGQGSAAARVPPQVGAIATPLEQVNWYYAGPEGRVPAIAELRGQVVLVHTWGYYCDPCVRKSVPYVADLMKAHRGEGLHAYSISVPINDGMPDDHCVEVGRELGMDHPIGVADGYGGMSPYVNMNVNKGLTWCFVIGREGGVRWAGDPSSDDDEFLEAVRVALREEPLPPLPEAMPEPLRQAVTLYVAGDLVRCRDEAEKSRAKYERRSGDADASVVAAAGQLVERIDEYRDGLVARLDAAFDARDAEGYVAVRRSLVERFPKSDAAKRVAELDARAKRDGTFRRAIDRWSEWEALRRAAPILFPVRADRESKRYAKQLQEYVERAGSDAPGVAQARSWLEEFRAPSPTERAPTHGRPNPAGTPAGS